jgi:hypothetical protein
MNPKLKLATLILALAFVFSLIINLNIILYNDGTRETTIIDNLLAKGYHFVLPKEYFNGVNYTKTAILIHDIDFSGRGIDTFMRIENHYGIKSAFYPRYTMLDHEDISYSLVIAKQEGFEIGFQYECLSQANGNMELAKILFAQQCNVMMNNWHISTTDYHGDVNKPDINNFDLYNAVTWKTYGLHEVYSLTNYSYYTDTNNNLQTPQILNDLVIVQLHTDWTR